MQLIKPDIGHLSISVPFGSVVQIGDVYLGIQKSTNSGQVRLIISAPKSMEIHRLPEYILSVPKRKKAKKSRLVSRKEDL